MGTDDCAKQDWAGMCLYMAALKAEVKIRFEKMEEALVLARELSARERQLSDNALEKKLEAMNAFQRRMDKLETTFATKPEVEKELRLVEKNYETVRRIVYIGLGLVFGLQFFMHYFLSTH